MLFQSQNEESICYLHCLHSGPKVLYLVYAKEVQVQWILIGKMKA